MKKGILVSLVLVSISFLFLGCGGQTQETAVATTTTVATEGTSTTTSTSSTTSSTSSSVGGYLTPSQFFNVSGAVAVASAAKISSSGVLHAWETATADDLVKFTVAGNAVSMITTDESYYYWYSPSVSVIETGPDGSLYVGLSSGIYLNVNGELKSVAFFRVSPSGDAEVVDPDIAAIGSWYTGYSSYQGELPAKQVQFGSDGTVYYLGTSSSGGYSANVLKKKTPAGVISQIGSSNMTVHNFLVCPNDMVLFQGSNLNDYSTHWLRVITAGNTVRNIYYNAGSSYGYLRSYYAANWGGDTYVILVGTNLLTYVDDVPKYVSGVFKEKLYTDGTPVELIAVLDDNTMYDTTGSYNTLGSQLYYGYWDYSDGDYHKFFETSDGYTVTLPLTLEAGISEEAIRTYIRGKYKRTTADTLDTVTFAGMTTDESYSSIVMSMLDTVISANISGETWSQWRTNNGFTSGLYFGYAKQILHGSGLYALYDKDGWNSSGTKGDVFLQIIDSGGNTSPEVFPQDSVRKDVAIAKMCGSDYIVYSAGAGGYDKLFRLDLSDVSASPHDLSSAAGNLMEIYNVNYDSSRGLVLYNIYDYDTNSMQLIEQDLVAATVSSEVSAEGYSAFIDIVPFVASGEGETETGEAAATL